MIILLATRERLKIAALFACNEVLVCSSNSCCCPISSMLDIPQQQKCLSPGNKMSATSNQKSSFAPCFNWLFTDCLTVLFQQAYWCRDSEEETLQQYVFRCFREEWLWSWVAVQWHWFRGDSRAAVRLKWDIRILVDPPTLYWVDTGEQGGWTFQEIFSWAVCSVCVCCMERGEYCVDTGSSWSNLF